MTISIRDPTLQACHPSCVEAEAGGAPGQHLPGLLSELKPA